jgi:hypothetical protein
VRSFRPAGKLAALTRVRPLTPLNLGLDVVGFNHAH